MATPHARCSWRWSIHANGPPELPKQEDAPQETGLHAIAPGSAICLIRDSFELSLHLFHSSVLDNLYRFSAKPSDMLKGHPVLHVLLRADIYFTSVSIAFANCCVGLLY